MKKDIGRIILELKTERERNKLLKNRFNMMRWILIIVMLIGGLSATVFWAKEPIAKPIKQIADNTARTQHEKKKRKLLLVPPPKPEQRPDGPVRPPIMIEATPADKLFMMLNGQKLSMIEDSNGRMNWIPENQIGDFEVHQIATKNFNTRNFYLNDFNAVWTVKMQESIFQKIQSRDDGLFNNVSIESVDCRSDVGCKIEAVAIDDSAKNNIGLLAKELGNIGRPKDGYFGRNYTMKTEKDSNFMEIFISGSVYD